MGSIESRSSNVTRRALATERSDADAARAGASGFSDLALGSINCAEALKSLSNRMIVMDRGAILAEGDPHTVLDDPRVQEAYMGGVV